MGNVEYSTENANYKQIYTIHTLPIKDTIFDRDKFDSIDAVVLEAYHSEEWFKLLWESPFKKHHSVVFDSVQRTGKPLYVVDVLTTPVGRGFEDIATLIPDFTGLILLYDGVSKVKRQIKEKKEMSRRQFLKFWATQTSKVVGGAYLGADLICRNYPIQTGDNLEFLARINSSRMHLIPTPQFELRNSITARKVEEFIAPELKGKLGKKPNIVLVYGAGHSGLREDIQHPGLRNFYLGLYKRLGFPGIDTTYLETITNVSINQEGNFSLEHRNANLFN